MVQGQGQGQGHSLHAAAALRWVCAQFQVRQQRQSTVVQQCGAAVAATRGGRRDARQRAD